MPRNLFWSRFDHPGAPSVHRRSPLRSLLRTGGVKTLFQPIVSTDKTPAQPFAFEALSRGLAGSDLEQAPVLFAAARSEGLEIQADRVCLASALLAGRALPQVSRIALNVHAHTLARDGALAPFIEESAARAGIALNRVILEIVEHLLESDLERAALNLDRLRGLGVEVAIDDFGAGGSRLALIHTFRPEIIKIDRHLLIAARDREAPREALELVIRHGRKLGARSVIEGVETQADLETAREAGADFVQGFLVGEPTVIANLETVAQPSFHAAPTRTPRSGDEAEEPANRTADWPQVQALELPILRFSSAGTLLDLNESALDLLGTDALESLGKDFSEIFTEATESSANGGRGGLAVIGGSGSPVVWSGDGESFRSLNVRPISTDGDQVLLLLEPLDEEAIRRVSRLFELFARGVSEQAMIILDSRGQVASWNQGAVDLLGHEKSEILHRPFHRLWSFNHHDPRVALEQMLATARANSSWQGELELIDSAGEPRPMRITILPIEDNDKRTQAFTVFALDLTARVRMQRNLESRERRLAMNLKIFETLLEESSASYLAEGAVQDLATQLPGCSIVLSLHSSPAFEKRSQVIAAGRDDLQISSADLGELACATLEAKKTLVVDDLETAECEGELPSQLLARNIRALITAPVMAADIEVARVAALASDRRSWSSEEIHSFEDGVRALSVAFSHLEAMAKLEQAEQRASEREAQIRALTDALPAAVYQAERQGTTGPAKLRYVSAGFERIFGRDASDIESFADLKDEVDESDRNAISKLIAQSRESGRPWSHDLKVRRADGSVRWIRASSSRRESEEGDSEVWNGVLVDVTDTKLAMDSLVQARNEWAATVDAVSDMIFLEDSDGRVLRCNRAVSSHFRRPFRSILGSDLVGLFFGPEAKGSERTAFRVPHKTLRLGGEASWFEISNFPVSQGPDRRSYWVHVLVNVTERRRWEENARRLAAAIEQTAEAIAVIDLQGRIQYQNAAYLRFTEVASGEGDSSSVFPQARRLLGREALRDIVRSLRTSGNWLGRHVLSNGDGTTRHLQLMISPVRDHAGKLINYVLVSSDVTERDRLEAIADAVNISEQTGFIFATLRHEIGNPINSIKAALSLLRRNFTEYPPELTRSYLDRTGAEVARVEYLLKLFKAFSANERLRPEEIRVSSFITEFTRLIQRDCGARGIALEVNVPDDSGEAYCDPRALNQALLNVITNALDAVDHTDEPRVVLSTRASGTSVLISVRDNGPGIPDSELENIFKPFFTTKEKGTGLGLPLVRKLLTKMGGMLDIHSETGVGTEVVITIPALRGEDQSGVS